MNTLVLHSIVDVADGFWVYDVTAFAESWEAYDAIDAEEIGPWLEEGEEDTGTRWKKVGLVTYHQPREARP